LCLVHVPAQPLQKRVVIVETRECLPDRVENTVLGFIVRIAGTRPGRVVIQVVGE